MSFHLATVNDTLVPSRATNFRPLRLGGPEGPIARYVATLGAAAENSWTIPEGRVVELAGGTRGCDLVFFRPGQETTTDEATEIHRLESLHGISTSDRTDLLCRLAPLFMRESASGVWDLEASGNRVFCESISLSGGISGGRWMWAESPMTLGATVVGGSACASGRSDIPAKACCGGCH